MKSIGGVWTTLLHELTCLTTHDSAVGVGVGVNVAVAVGDAVGVAVGLGAVEQYLPPVFK